MALVGILILLGTFLLGCWYLYTPRGRNPPGPTPLPLIGNLLPFLFAGPNRFAYKLIELRKEYGDVFTVYIGHIPFIFVNGYETIRETLVKNADATSSRPDAIGPHLTDGAGLGLSFSPHWKEQRKFAVTILRDFGLGRGELEARVHSQAEVLLDYVSKYNGNPTNPTELLRASVANVIGAIMFGKRFELDDPDFMKVIQAVRSADLASNIIAIVASYISVLMWLPGDLLGIKRNQRHHTELLDIIRQKVAEHKEALDPTSPKDYVDFYLLRMEKDQDEGIATSFTEENLVIAIKDIFMAGTNTTSTTLEWTLMFIAQDQELQTRIREEIETVVGFERVPTMSDQPNMPVLNSALTEVFRMNQVTPLGLPHYTDADTTVNGVVIPKDRYLYGFLFAGNRDEHVFEKPGEYRPGRFLVPENVDSAQKVMAFGAGRRVCPGERLARMELFIFLTHVLQRFKVEFGSYTSTVEPIFDRPQSHTLIFKPLAV